MSSDRVPSPGPPPKPTRGIIPPPYRQPPPPPGNEVGNTENCQSPRNINNNCDTSHVYKNVAEIAMYSDRFLPSSAAKDSSQVNNHLDIPTIQSSSKLAKLQQDHRQKLTEKNRNSDATSNGSPRSNLDKPVPSKKPGFIQQRLRSLLPHGLAADSTNKKGSVDMDQPKNNTRDPLLNGKHSQIEGVDNPGHCAGATFRTDVENNNNSSNTQDNRFVSNGEPQMNGTMNAISPPSTSYKDWSKLTNTTDDGHNSARLRSTCSKIFKRDPVPPPSAVNSLSNSSINQSSASILAKNTTTAQEYDKVGQKEGVMKQLEQIESRNLCIIHNSNEVMSHLNDRRTPTVDVTTSRSAESNDFSRSSAVEDANLLPEQTYTIEKRGARLKTNANEGNEETEEPVYAAGVLSNLGSVSSGVYSMSISGRNSDTSRTSTSPIESELTSKPSRAVSSVGGVSRKTESWNYTCKDGEGDGNNLKPVVDQHLKSSTQPNNKESIPMDLPPGTPPLPPVSPDNTPPESPIVSSKLDPNSKYRLSLSTTPLDRDLSSNTEGMVPNHVDAPKSKKTASSLPKQPRNSVTKQSDSRQRSGRSKISQANYNKSWDSSKVMGNPHHQLPVKSGGGRSSKGRNDFSNFSSKRAWPLPSNKISVSHPDDLSTLDQDIASTTTGLDMDSLLDGPGTLYTSDSAPDESLSTNSQIDSNDMFAIRKQLEGLENLYSEVLKMLGSKPRASANRLKYMTDQLKSSNKRRAVYGSLSSLSMASRSNNYLFDRTRINGDKKRSRENKGGVNKRFQRLESHVVTLARSVAHLSSEMRSQHMMYQEIENLRRDLNKMREEQQQQQQQQQLYYHKHSSSAASSPTPRASAVPGTDGRNFSGTPLRGRSHYSSRHSSSQGHRASTNHHHSHNQPSDLPKDERISLTNLSRVKKLTKFFGAEPPLLRQFLKSLGYENFASIFESEGIGLAELPYLTDERFEKLGVPMGPRLRIMQEAQIAFSSSNSNVYIL